MAKKKKVETFDIKALGEYVVIKKVEPEEISAGGIILEGVKAEVYEGTVVSAGKDVDPKEISVGDTVLLPPMAGRTVDIRGNELVVMTQQEVMVKLC